MSFVTEQNSFHDSEKQFKHDDTTIIHDSEKQLKHDDPTITQDGSLPKEPSVSDGESFTEDAQEGVKAMEAVTTIWTKTTLAAALVL